MLSGLAGPHGRRSLEIQGAPYSRTLASCSLMMRTRRVGSNEVRCVPGFSEEGKRYCRSKAQLNCHASILFVSQRH